MSKSRIGVSFDFGELPTFTIRQMLDLDGDFTYYEMLVDYDGTLDGVEKTIQS